MYIKQFLLLATAFAYLTNGLSATTSQLTEIAKGILDHKIAINDQVIYEDAIYTIASFDIATKNNNGSKKVRYQLKKPVIFLNIEWGTDVFDIDVKRHNDGRYTVSIYYYYFNRNNNFDNTVLICAIAGCGWFLLKNIDILKHR